MQALGTVKFGDVTIKIISNSEALTMAELHFTAHAIAAVHHHTNEEINYVLEGTFEAIADGHKRILTAGDVIHVTTNHNHNLTCISDVGGKILTVWTPSRKDLMAKIATK